jgi:hypothetical protein
VFVLFGIGHKDDGVAASLPLFFAKGMPFLGKFVFLQKIDCYAAK